MQAKAQQYVTSGPSAFSVELDAQTNIYAMDQANWSNLQAGRRFRYVDGGRAVRSPAVVRVPSAGTWWVVVEAIPGRTLNFSISPI